MSISTEQDSSEKKYNFQTLTPTHDVKMGIYENALDYAFSKEEIKNIAISGAYSSGKSSVIESYKKLDKNKQFIHISLARFEPLTKTSSALKESVQATTITETKPQQDESVSAEIILEGKIINSLIHQIDPNKIPLTDFKVKYLKSKKDIAIFTIVAIFFFLSSFHNIFFDHFSDYVSTVSWKWLSFFAAKETQFFTFLICTCILGYVIYKISGLLKNKSIFKRLNLQGNEIEILGENTDSFFDKHLNEVLYLFKSANVDAIVFEDIDRYNANIIFERLREVNTLVNKKNKEDKSPLRFIYLLRDDIFTSKDRTKFFDFIIPIVPVIDSSNSYEQFITRLQEGGIYDDFDEYFLKEISLYIDDMRILKNIYNEFIIYNERINITELGSNNLLAIIIYKNLFPKDFNDLQLCGGYIHTIFSKKNISIEQEMNNIVGKINTYKEKIKKAENEMLRDTNEVNYLYGKMYPRDSPEYADRLESVNNRNDDVMKKLNHDILKFEKQMEILENKKLCEIITNENSDRIFDTTYKNEIGKETDFSEIKVSPYFALIKYLLRNGYIDESYPDYMTYFYDNSLSQQDKMFLRSVTDKKAKNYTYELKNSKILVTMLRPSSSSQKEILNFDLLSYLLNSTEQKDVAFLKGILTQLRDRTNYDFIRQFFDTQKEQKNFVIKLNEVWNEFFNTMMTESCYKDAWKREYALTTLYSTNDSITNANTANSLKDFISSSPNFLNITTPNIQKIIAAFTSIKVCFKSIDYEVSNKELFSEVYKHNCYDLNYEMICLMLKHIYDIPESKDFKTKNYTLVMSKPDESLAKSVNNSIKTYLDLVFANCDDNILDDAKAVLHILNNDAVDIERKEKYINLLKTQINPLEAVTNVELWSLLLEKNLLKYSEDNILTYFFKSEKNIDTTLIEFINKGKANLNINHDSIENNFDKNSGSKFFNALVDCNELLNERYENILVSFNKYYTSFNKKNIIGDKIAILIKLKIIRMSKEVLLFMRENYPNHVIAYIKENIAVYMDETISENNFDFDEMLSVLELDVADKYKIALLQFDNSPITIENKNYSNEVTTYILANNFDYEDIPELISSYSSHTSEIKNAIETICVNDIEVVLVEEYPMSELLLEKLVSSKELDETAKIKLFVQALPDFDKETCKKYLSLLKLKALSDLLIAKRSKQIPYDETNQKFLEIFKTKKWIKDFKIDSANTHYQAFT